MRKAVQVLFCAAAVLAGSPAAATDYTFNVPVRIENMSNATEAWVACGWLVAQLQSDAASCAVALRAVGRVKRFW